MFGRRYRGHVNQPFAYGNAQGKGQPTVKVCCAGDTSLALTIRDGKVVLAPASESDDKQRWIKKMKASAKDEEGYPAFALVNKATNQAIKHSTGESEPVRLATYAPEDQSLLWTESSDGIRQMNNVYLKLYAGRSNQKVREGTEIVLRFCDDDNKRCIMQPC